MQAQDPAITEEIYLLIGGLLQKKYSCEETMSLAEIKTHGEGCESKAN